MQKKLLRNSERSIQMKKYNVRIAEIALSDMEAIYAYISEKLHAPNAALSRYNRIADAIISLESNPKRYKIMDSEPECFQGIRRVIVDNYSVFFIIDGENVDAIRELYSASDIGKRLNER